MSTVKQYSQLVVNRQKIKSKFGRNMDTSGRDTGIEFPDDLENSFHQGQLWIVSSSRQHGISVRTKNKTKGTLHRRRFPHRPPPHRSSADLKQVEKEMIKHSRSSAANPQEAEGSDLICRSALGSDDDKNSLVSGKMDAESSTSLTLTTLPVPEAPEACTNEMSVQVHSQHDCQLRVTAVPNPGTMSPVVVIDQGVTSVAADNGQSGNTDEGRCSTKRRKTVSFRTEVEEIHGPHQVHRAPTVGNNSTTTECSTTVNDTLTPLVASSTVPGSVNTSPLPCDTCVQPMTCEHLAWPEDGADLEELSDPPFPLSQKNCLGSAGNLGEPEEPDPEHLVPSEDDWTPLDAANLEVLELYEMSAISPKHSSRNSFQF